MYRERTLQLVILFFTGGLAFPGPSAPAGENRPVLVKVVTAERDVVVGALKSQTDSQIELIELTTNETIVISNDRIQQVRKDIAENEAVHSVGLGNVLAWKILNTVPNDKPEGRIVKVDQATIYVSLGEKGGAKADQELRVYRGASELKDPVTGKILGVEKKLIGRLIVVEVRENYSKARALGDLETTFEIGDTVEPAGANNGIVVFPFVTVEGQSTATGRELAEQLTTALVQRDIRVVERSQFVRALTELVIQNTPLFDAEKAQKIGRQVGAYAALLGTLNFAGRTTEVNVRLIEVETGRILFAGEYRLYGMRADTAPGPAVARVANSRTRWLNTSYDQTLYYVQGKQWVERNNQTQEVTARLTEIRRTPDYVDLSGFNFGVGRVYGTRMEMNKGGRWEWVSNGRWLDSLSP